MDSQLLSISKIFTDKLYRIPDYQRGYAWTEKQLKDFWNDIIQLEEGKNHYVGVLTLEKVPKEVFNKWSDDNWIIKSKNYEPYFIVDGQQRLTTTIILIQAITERVSPNSTLNFATIAEVRKRYIFDSKDKGISRSYIFGYEKDNPSYEFLKRKIFLENSTSGYRKEETIYTQNLIFAKEYLSSKIKELNRDALEIVFRKITQNLLFNIYTITSDIDVFIAFETMNNRGKPLSNLELLKNRLIYLSTKVDVEESEKEQLRKRINNSWKSVYHYLGRNKANPLNDDTFLMNHFIIYFGDEFTNSYQEAGIYNSSRRPSLLLKERYESFLLEEKFNTKNLIETDSEGRPKLSIEEINNYIESLQQSVEIWFNLFNPQQSDFEEEEKNLLEKIFRINSHHFSALVLICYLKKVNKKTKLKFLETLERFGFVSMLGYKYRAPLMAFGDFALDISKGKTTIAELEKELTKTIQKKIMDTDFIIEATRRFSGGFYEWMGIRYFLYEFDMHLRESSKSKKKKINWIEFIEEKDDYITVEHIYPQDSNTDCWKIDFSRYTPRQREILKNSLGNLLPLSKPKNSSLQNKCFLKKIDNDTNQVGYRYGSYSENEISKLTEWTPQEILKKGLKLLEFMERKWNIPLGDIQQKTKLLGLTFIKTE
ncbi:DUF262 domain-containing protein [Chitinophaga sp. SYP-B3965]|uniref:DUF262 domain-containing protein n=1 Tax=Chitinophaga sp. SYP-B3965 TaxID=2663120 RepID=UPI00129973F7|nr:DUF262 domain-containing protein [Chitinophaga sp. SYP-B3965]MRG47453.1 DUF262 domain-containing protein [Chitinophaga sp. SYP-B3965]